MTVNALSRDNVLPMTSYLLNTPASPVLHMNRKSSAIRQIDIQYIIIVLSNNVLYRKSICIIQNIKQPILKLILFH